MSQLTAKITPFSFQSLHTHTHTHSDLLSIAHSLCLCNLCGTLAPRCHHNTTQYRIWLTRSIKSVTGFTYVLAEWVGGRALQRWDSLFPTMLCMRRPGLGKEAEGMECRMAHTHTHTQTRTGQIQEPPVPIVQKLASRWAYTGSSQLRLLPVC